MILDALYEIAADSHGYFTTAQARDAGVDPKSLSALAHRGRLRRISHGVYRIARFPESEYDYLTEALLWPLASVTALCRESALVAYGISDANPRKIHVLVPKTYRTHRDVPPQLELHQADFREEELWDWNGLKVTSPTKSIEDCRDANVRPDIVEGAVRDARELGLIAPRTP